MIQKNKVVWAISGVLLLFIVAIQFGFLKTVELYKNVEELRNTHDQYSNTSGQFLSLTAKEKQYDSILNTQNIKSFSVQSGLLNTLTKLSDSSNVKIINFEEPHQVISKDTIQKISTYKFTLQGNYKSLMALIYQLEQRFVYGDILHVEMRRKKKYGRKLPYVESTVYLQRKE